MRSLLTMIIFVFCHASLAQTTLVVTDVDDTLRLTHRKASVWEQLQNVADPSLGFYGMLEVLKGLDQQKASIYYVSGSIAPVSEFGADFLISNGYPQQENYLYRGWFESTKDFKIRVIEDLINQKHPDKVIFFGDNGEFDVEVAEAIIKTHVNVSSYIHQLYGSEGTAIPSSQSLFLTGADLALQLYLQGHLTESQTESAIRSVTMGMAPSDPYYLQLVFPHWSDLSAKDIDRAFGSKHLWPQQLTELLAIESFVSQNPPISLP